MFTHGRWDEPLFGGANEVVLATGTLRRGDGVCVELERADGSIERVTRPTPLHGVGGAELVVSPDEQWAALFVYSGQSEVGWELFLLVPRLVHVTQLPYVAGRAMAPVFSPDSQWLVLVVAEDPRSRETGELAEDVLDGSEGRVLVDWGRVHALHLPAQSTGFEVGPSDSPSVWAVESAAIGTWVSRAMDPEELLAWRLDDARPVFVAPATASVALPWGGELPIALPLGGPLTTADPPESPLDRTG